MAVKKDYIDIMVNIPGFSVHRVSTHTWEGDEFPSLMIELSRDRNVYKCRCGREFSAYYDCDERCVRDLSYGVFKRSYLFFYQVRVDCPDRGVVTESLEWTLPRVEYSKRLAAEVALACEEIRSLIHTSLIEGVNNKIKVIKRIAFGFRDMEYFFLKIRGAFHAKYTHT